MTGIKSTDHIDRFSSPDLSDHDSVGTHSQGGFNQISNGNFLTPLHVGISCLQLNQIRNMPDLQFRIVFNGNDALIAGDAVGQGV